MWPSLPFTRCRSSGGRRTAVCEPTRCGFPAGPAPRVPQVSPSPRACLPPRRPCGPTTCTPRTRKRRNPAAGGTGRGRVGVRGAAGDPHPLGLPAEVQGRSSESRGRDGAAPALRALPTVACADRPGPRSAPSRLPVPPPRRITDWALVACPGTRAAAKRFGHLIRFPRPWGRGAGVACSGAGVGTTGSCAFAGLLAWATT